MVLEHFMEHKYNLIHSPYAAGTYRQWSVIKGALCANLKSGTYSNSHFLGCLLQEQLLLC